MKNMVGDIKMSNETLMTRIIPTEEKIKKLQDEEESKR